MFHLKNFVLGIGIIIIFGLLLWQGIEAFYPSPDWNKMCGDKSTIPASTQETCVAAGGRWNPDSAPKAVDSQGNVIAGYCDLYYQCTQELDKLSKAHSQVVFIISLIVGILILFISYLFIKVEPVGSALMGAGIWAIFWGSAVNWHNISNIWRFLLLLIAFVLIVWITVKINTSKKSIFAKIGLKR